jgi:16S rRNA (adenine1518-N6/adenine1519-N6)-dimethyltransferase
VESAFVRLVPEPRRSAEVQDPDAFAQVVSLAFGQRRKTLRNSLSPILNVADIQACGIDPAVRPDRLDIAAFARLANRLARSPFP